MKYLVFNQEQFSEGGYSKLFNDVITSLMHNGIIMSPDASMEVYKAIYEKGASSTAECISILDNKLVLDEKKKMYIRDWNELKDEL